MRHGDRPDANGSALSHLKISLSQDWPPDFRLPRHFPVFTALGAPTCRCRHPLGRPFGARDGALRSGGGTACVLGWSAVTVCAQMRHLLGLQAHGVMRVSELIGGAGGLVTFLAAHRVVATLRRHSRIVRLIDQPPRVLVGRGEV
jgi:hypothetical protein